MEILYKKLDTADINFDNEFLCYRESFFNILSKTYPIYYGQDYHQERIQASKAVIYLVLVDNLLVGVSYVKRNLRRGGTAIFPEHFRRLGLAEHLVKLSLCDFPNQYSILSTDLPYSSKMLNLMSKVGFKNACDVEEIKKIVGEEFIFLSNFRKIDNRILFDRKSNRRSGVKREYLTLVHTYNI